jgi:hypothetical protein
MQEFEPRVGLVSDGLFYTPLFRWFVIEWTGVLRRSNKQSIKELLDKKASANVFP